MNEDEIEEIGRLCDQCDSLLFATQLRVPDSIHVIGLTGGVEELRDRLRRLHTGLSARLGVVTPTNPVLVEEIGGVTLATQKAKLRPVIAAYAPAPDERELLLQVTFHAEDTITPDVFTESISLAIGALKQSGGASDVTIKMSLEG